MRKQQLPGSKNNERINAAQYDGEENCRHNRATEFSKEIFHKFSVLISSEMQTGDHEINHFDPDERDDDAANAVNQQVAPQNFRRAERLEFHAAQRQRNQ